MFSTLFKPYLKKYLILFKKKKWLVDINMNYIYIFYFGQIHITFLFVTVSIFF